jgi:hypothetical protein
MIVSDADALRPKRDGRLRNRCGAEAVRRRRTECAQDIGGTTERGLSSMHAESREFIGRADSEAPIVTGDAPISPSTALISTDGKEAGLWLWQGEPLPPPALPRPESRDRQFLLAVMPVARWAGWIAVPAGLALAFLAVSMAARQDRPVSADAPAVALPSGPSPAVTRPIAPVLPAEVTQAKLDQVQMPSAGSAAKITAQGPEPPVVKGRAQRKLSRTARKTHASHVRRGPPVPIAGVLTPPVMTWHGGGY